MLDVIVLTFLKNMLLQPLEHEPMPQLQGLAAR